MPKEIIYETKNVRMYIDETIPCLVGIWDGFMPSKAFRENILKSVELLKEYRPKYPNLAIFEDTRTLGIVSRADVQWVLEEITHLYLEIGVRYEAFLLSKDAFGQLAVQRYASQCTDKGQFIVQTFDSYDEAYQWLKSVTQIKP